MQTNSNNSPRWSSRWQVVALFWFAYLLNQADRQVIFSVFPLIQQDWSLSQTQLGLIGSLFFWVYGALVPLAGSLGDVCSRKKIISTALLVWSAATLSSGLAGGLGMLLFMRAVTAAGEAFYYPSANSILSDYHGTATRSTAMSLHQTAVYFGIITSGWLAGWIGEHYGWRTSFLVFGAIGICFALVLFKLLREPQRGLSELTTAQTNAAPLQEMSWPERVAETFRRPTAITLIFGFVCMNFVNAAYLPWMTKLLYEKFQFSLATAGFHATFWHHVGAFAGVLIGGRLADLFAARSRLSRLLIQVAGLLCGAPFIFLMGWSSSSVIVFAALGLFGVFRGLYDSNLFASLYEVVRPAARATATGIMLAIAFLLGGTSSLLTGWLSQRMSLGMALASTSLAYLVAGLASLCAAVFWFRRDAANMQQAMRAASATVAGTELKPAHS